jgi:glycosyltransferase involved in cell wall biosynthesis
MKLSVLVQSYNHQDYITQALESVLSQRTSFGWEVVVGDDCSTDGTRRILEGFKARYPDRLSLLLPATNLGSGGRTLSRLLLEGARGQYVACLDGDDYWLGVDKLERQVRFLDDHPDCSMCWHRAYNLYPDQSLTPYENNFDYDHQKSYYSLSDVIFQNFIPTASIVFRNGLVTLPPTFTTVPAADWFYNALLAERGPLAFLNEVWSVRRVHAGGLISMKSPEAKLQFNIDCVHMIDTHFHNAYRTEAKARLAYLHRELAIRLRDSGQRWKAAVQAAKSLVASPADSRWPRVDTLAMIVGNSVAPSVDLRLRRFDRNREGR